MNLFLMVTLVVLAVVIGDVFKKYLSTRNPPTASRELISRVADMEKKLSKIESRISNLETIATSKDFKLEREFRELERQKA